MKLHDYILDDRNIYLAIYSVKSYVFDQQLLSKEDMELLNMLSDPFNEEIIMPLVGQVKKIVRNIIDDEKYLFKTQVYFKPKEYVDSTNIIYRPIHTAELIQLIAMVAVLHPLIYEIPNKDDEWKLNLSNYSRIIPNNFYGNRVSNRPEELFKRWNSQYKKYTQQANEYFKTFRESKEYKYELKLDLVNFFPSVNPLIIYGMLIENIPVTMCSEDNLNVFKRIIKKLLICEITNLKNELALQHYYGSSKIDYCLTKGIAQGLPQSYFFGNITMIQISKIFEDKYKGKSVYYVDDSYIYTNLEIENTEQFIEQLEDINEKIRNASNRYEENAKKDIGCRFNKNENVEEELLLRNQDIEYGISVHTRKKSTYTDIKESKDGEAYLRILSREASQIGSDILSTYSEDEDLAMLHRTSALLKSIKLERNSIDERKEKSYYDKLERYYKFFEYREMKLKLKTKNKIDKDLFFVLLQNEIAKKGSLYKTIAKTKIEADQFFVDYAHDIWQTAISLLIANTVYEHEHADIREYINNVISVAYPKELTECSYIKRMYTIYLGEEVIKNVPDPYFTLGKSVNRKMVRYANMNVESLKLEFKQAVFEGLRGDILRSLDICSKKFVEITEFVNQNSDRLQRMFLNAVYSKIFKVTLSEDVVINSYDKKGISYGALRVLVYLRNANCEINKFLKWQIELMSPENSQKVDYTLFEVLGAYKKYVVSPENIDTLILVHKYTCDVWKNGAKHLYFYTLHNQEHAVDLIKNIIKVVKVFSYFKITNYDYYILFIACYLHDISMVRIASEKDFLLDKDESELLTTKIDETWSKKRNTAETKRAIIETYKDVDYFFEKKIRTNHAKDSATEIRRRKELDFLGESVRECVAEIAESHMKDTKDIYFVKGDAKNRLISYKFDEILLRIADLLDMSEHRVSKPILNHNLDNMSLKSAFHWVSHLLTEGYRISTQYDEYRDGETKSSLAPGSIQETITFSINVNLSQFSRMTCKECLCGEIDEASISSKGISINLTHEGKKCVSEKCNFLC